MLVLTTFDEDEYARRRCGRAPPASCSRTCRPATCNSRAHGGEGGSWLDPAVTGRVLSTYRRALSRPAAPNTAADMLTAREREVLALIGQGLTNSEIAATWCSAGTVKTHIGHIFTKLDLRDRAAAVIFAIDHYLATRRTDSE